MVRREAANGGWTNPDAYGPGRWKSCAQKVNSTQPKESLMTEPAASAITPVRDLMNRGLSTLEEGQSPYGPPRRQEVRHG